MTLDQLIAKLQEIKAGPTGDRGEFTVYVQCPVADNDCWLHANYIEIAHGENESSFVRLAGGIGA